MTDIYEDQLRSIDLRIAAAEKQLRDASADDPMREFLREDLDQLQSQKNTYEQAIRANRGIGDLAVEAADQAAKYSQQQRDAAKDGLGAVGSKIVDIGTGLGQYAVERLSPLPTVNVATGAAGSAASTYRALAGEEYESQKALGAAALGLGGYLAGAGLSRAVGSAGLSVMRSAGVQNNILPNIITGGLSGVGFAAGMTGGSELAKALADENYQPDWGQISTDAVAAFAFGAISSAVRIARSSSQNKSYVERLSQEVQQRYATVKEILRSGNAAQRAQGAASVMDGVERLRGALNDLQFVGAQKQVDSIRTFLNSIDAEMAQYLPNGATAAAGAVSGPATAIVPGAAPVRAPAAAQGAPSAGSSHVLPGSSQTVPPAVAPAAPVPVPAGSGASASTMPAQGARTPQTAPPSHAGTGAQNQEQPVEEAFPPVYYENIEREPAPEPETPGMTVPTGSTADLEPLAKTLGQSGRRAMTAFYDSDIPAADYAEDFIKAYNAGKSGADRPSPRYIGEPVAVAAYFAGQNDAPKQFEEFDESGAPVFATTRAQAQIEPADFADLKRRRDAADKTFGLDQGESVSLGNYVKTLFRVLNNRLYSGTMSDKDQPMVDRITSALKKFPTFDGKTYRNLSFQDELSFNSYLSEFAQGETVTLKAFTSTSKRPNGYPKFGDYVVHMVIEGTSGADIADTYGIPRQQEVIFLPGTQLKINSIGTANDGHPIIYAQEAESYGLAGDHGDQRPQRGNEADRPEGGTGRTSRSGDGGLDRGVQAPPQRDGGRDGLLSQRGAGRDGGAVLEVSPQQQIADKVRYYLEKGTQFSPARLFEIADKAYGGTMAEGTYTVKDAYDGMELAVNQYLMSGPAKSANGSAAQARAFLSWMEQLLNLLPTQTKRTAEMESYQQFSTPPNIAYLAAWAANVAPTDVVLEPSAGIGGLALWPKAWGAAVYANELSTRRLAFLNRLGLDGTFNLNAEQIDNLLPESIKPTVIIMNPPFSSTAGRTSTNKTANAKRHIEQALERLEPRGRLVAILGRGMSEDAASFKSWWADLKKEYNVLANIQLDGSNYKKYGTNFDVQLVVIDKTGATTGETLTGTYKDLSKIPELMEGIRNERKGIVRNSDPVSGRTSATRAVSQAGTASGYPAGSAAGQLAAGQQGGAGGLRAPDGAGRGKRSGVRSGPGGERKPVPGGTGRADGSGVVPGNAGPRMALSGGAGAGVDGGSSAVTAENPDSTYAAYAPRKVHIKGARPHPARLVESAAMAAVEPPDPAYTPALPERIAKEGVLSDAQLENVVYAGQAHSQKLADGRRKGFFIGDGTGVGKGRQIAGIIMDNFLQGRRKAVWISEKASLLEDARRDWKDLGGNPDEILDLKNPHLLKNGIQADSGIVFGPYSTLRSQKEARLKMLEDWLGKDFDGVIALDEAHNMGNSVSIKRGRGKSKPAAQALAGIDLQRAFPNARVVYASATGATDISQYGYLERLGLWGKGTAFNDLNDFIEKISNGGLAAMELVARDMKSMGVYMARSISYDDVKYDTIQHDLTPMQTEIYNTMSRAWQKVLQNVNEALKITGADKNGQARGAAYSAIFSGQQRFYNQILTSMSMPTVIEDMRRELAAGRSVVLQLTNTNEAQAARAIAKNEAEGGDLDDIDLTPSETLRDLLVKSFPTTVYEEYTDDEGRTRSRMVVDANGDPVIDRKAVRMRDALVEELSQMKVPDGPLEMLFDAFGVDQVAEVTGRTQRIVEKRDANGVLRRVHEKRGPTSGTADTKLFQDGKKRILVFSEAGGTGRSYHADLRAKNQQQRVHYLLQAGWNASKAVQGFGRTHRSNQASAPIFRLVTTNVMGQKRFTSTIARRLDQLGALTKGQRQAGSGVFSEKDNLENPIAADALSVYYKSVNRSILKKLGLYDKIYDENGRINDSAEDLRNVSKFLNRILSLEVEEQNEVFQGFYDTFERMLDNAIANGTVDMGLENYRAEKVDVVDEKVIRKDATGADTKYVQMIAYKRPDTISFDRVPTASNNFRKLVRMEDGEVRAVYEISPRTNSAGEIERRFKLQSPQIGKTSIYAENTMNTKTADIPKKEWKAAWEEQLAKVPEFTETRLHMLTGTLLPIWDRLPTDNTRVMRVVTSDGRQYLGRVIAPTQIDGVLRNLGANRTKETYTPGQIQDAVLGQGREAILRDNRQRIVRRRVSGEWRMEIVGQNTWYLARQYPGILTERINFEYRYFIPTGQAGEKILSDLMKNNPVVEIRSSAPEEERMAAPGGRDRQWSADRVGNRDKTPKSLSEIAEDIRHSFGLNITTGHIRGKGTLGTYNRRSQGIRSKIHNDLPTISHELGHHLDNTYRLTMDAGRDALRELTDGLSPDMRDAYPQKKWGTEGLAEYVRKFLQNREVTAIDYPRFTEYFMGKLSGKDAAILDQLADEINAYYSLGADSAASSIRLREERGPDARTLSEKIRDKGDGLYQAWVDINHGIKLFDEAVGTDTYKLAANAAYADAMAANIILHELRDAEGAYVGPGLSTVLHGINLRDKAEYRAFGEYLTVRHGPERLKEGMRVYADDRKNSSQWMQNRQHELEVQYPDFREVSDRLYAFQRQLLQTWGVNTGLVSAKNAKEWGERWKFYVPFNRAMDEQQLRGARRGFANQNSTIRRARGSGRDIIHPVDNIIANMVAMVNAGVRNNVMRRITDAAERSEDYAVFLEKVPVPLKQKQFDAKDLKKGLTESVMDSALSDADKDLMVEIVSSLNNILIQYGRGRAYGDVITVMKGGTQEFWKINDPLLLQSVTNMSPGKLNGILDAYAVVSRFMTGNITGKNLLWSIFSNAPRDLMTFFTYSKDKNPLHVFGGIGAAYANKIKGGGADPLFMEYLAMGGGQTSVYTADRDLTRTARKKMSGSRSAYANPMEWIAFTSDMIEMGPRFATYKMMREKGMIPQDAFYEAMDITVNFRRGGRMAREVNKVVPFFNASVQGLDKFSRWIRAADAPPAQRFKIVRSRVISYLVASAALAAAFYGLNNSDEEKEADYQQLSNYTKNSYWLIPLGDGKYFAIPKPRELAVLSSFFETAAEALAGENPHAFDEFIDYVLDNGLPPVLSELSQGDWEGAIGSLGLIGTGAYLMANRDFLGRPIESSGLSNLEPKDRYTTRTSQIARAVGQAFNISPQKIDYFFNSVLGGFWKAQKALFPVGKENVDFTLGIQNTYIKDNQYSLDLVNWLYDQAERSSQAANSDPSDLGKAIEKKMDANMTSFYSRYYALAKDQPDTTTHRSTRQTVLDMIREYRKAYDLNSTTQAQEAVYAVCKEQNSTEYLPGVMQITVKDGNDIQHTLSDVQYVEFQTEYLGLYWELAEDVLSDGGSTAERAALLKEAKNTAKEQAVNRVLRRIGAPIVQDYDYGDIPLADVAEFNSIYSSASSDKDADGNTIPGSKQDKVIAGIASIEGLTDEQRSELFRSVYDSDKNNPWAAGETKKYWWQ
ncbi:strawberry notch family protein [Dysosmobacter sp. Marseille-Q4140]|nr:strawberry notch family protein [Dysosmobacter sp. Marseille-Q4140]